MSITKATRFKRIISTMALAVVAAVSTATIAEPLETLSIYDEDGIVGRNKLYLGTPTNWAFVVPDKGKGEMDVGQISIEPTDVAGEKGIKVVWNGGIGQIYSQTKRKKDFLDYVDAKGALVFEAIVHQPPQDQVTMRVDCGYPCMGVVDMTNYYKSAPVDEKVTVKIPLSCFEQTGTSFTGVNTPWLIYTTQPFAVSLANIRWVAGAADAGDVVKC